MIGYKQTTQVKESTGPHGKDATTHSYHGNIVGQKSVSRSCEDTLVVLKDEAT